jgi:hypothetical protein
VWRVAVRNAPACKAAVHAQPFSKAERRINPSVRARHAPRPCRGARQAAAAAGPVAAGTTMHRSRSNLLVPARPCGRRPGCQIACVLFQWVQGFRKLHRRRSGLATPQRLGSKALRTRAGQTCHRTAALIEFTIQTVDTLRTGLCDGGCRSEREQRRSLEQISVVSQVHAAVWWMRASARRPLRGAAVDAPSRLRAAGCACRRSAPRVAPMALGHLWRAASAQVRCHAWASTVGEASSAAARLSAASCRGTLREPQPRPPRPSQAHLGGLGLPWRTRQLAAAAAAYGR